MISDCSGISIDTLTANQYRILNPAGNITINITKYVSAILIVGLIRFHYVRQSGFIGGDIFKWIGSLQTPVSMLIAKGVNVNPKNALALIPGFRYLVFDPFAVRRFTADQNQCTGGRGHLGVNPMGDRRLAAQLGAFPVIRNHRLRAIISELSNPPHVARIMKTKECSVSHHGEIAHQTT